jgi:hypothetical protein
MEYSIQDIIDAAVESQPTKAQDAFNALIGQRVMTALEAKKRDIASSMFNPITDTEVEDENAEDQNIEPAEEDDQPA